MVAASDEQRVAPALPRTSIVKREEQPARRSSAARSVKSEEPAAVVKETPRAAKSEEPAAVAKEAPRAAKSEEPAALAKEAPRTIKREEPLAATSDAARVVKVERDLFEPAGSSSKFPIKLVITGGAVIALGLALFLLRDHLGLSKPSAGAGAASSLQMQVESQGSGIINIRWNPQSAIVAQAREGRLVILEHDQQPRTIALGPEQLKIGHLFYQSPVESVEFRLEIVSPSGEVTKDSVLALASAKAAEPAAGAPIAPTAPKAGEQEPASARNAAEAQPEKKVEAKTESKSETKSDAKTETKPEAAVVKKPADATPARPLATRSFTPPPGQKKTGEPGALIFDPPPSVPSSAAALPAVNLPEARIAAPPAPAPPPPQPLKSGGDLQAPKLIKRVTPDYPAAARAANVQGIVKFTATIAKDGTLHNVQAVGGPTLLIPAATEAVKKWVYQPMMLDGQPVEVVTQIEVNFALHQ